MSSFASHRVVELSRVLQSLQVKHCTWKRCPAARTSSASYTDFAQRGHLGAPAPNIADRGEGRGGQERDDVRVGERRGEVELERETYTSIRGTE